MREWTRRRESCSAAVGTNSLVIVCLLVREGVVATMVESVVKQLTPCTVQTTAYESAQIHYHLPIRFYLGASIPLFKRSDIAQ